MSTRQAHFGTDYRVGWWFSFGWTALLAVTLWYVAFRNGQSMAEVLEAEWMDGLAYLAAGWVSAWGMVLLSGGSVRIAGDRIYVRRFPRSTARSAPSRYPWTISWRSPRSTDRPYGPTCSASRPPTNTTSISSIKCSEKAGPCDRRSSTCGLPQGASDEVGLSNDGVGRPSSLRIALPQYAAIPVTACPKISPWISCVPSYV